MPKIPLPLKIAISLLLLAFVLSKVDIPAVFGAVAKSNVYLVSLAIAISFACWFLNTLKWQVLLAGPGTHLSYWQLLRLNFVAMFYNLVLPGQVGGEVIKGVTLSRMGVTPMASAVSVVADRVSGLLAIFLLGLGGALLAPSSLGSQTQAVPWLAGIGVVLAVATVVLVTGRGPALVLTLGRSVGLSGRGLSPRLVALSRKLEVPTRSWSALWIPLLISFGFQLLVVLTNLLLCMAFGLSVGFVELLWVVAAVSLVQSLPISIAGLGVREGAYVYLLHQQGVDTSHALAVSLTVFAIQVLMASVGGFLQLIATLKRSPRPAESTSD